MAFSPQINIYQGNRNLQIKVLDLQPGDSYAGKGESRTSK
jgi:hypothetical protein